MEVGLMLFPFPWSDIGFSGQPWVDVVFISGRPKLWSAWGGGGSDGAGGPMGSLLLNCPQLSILLFQWQNFLSLSNNAWPWGASIRFLTLLTDNWDNRHYRPIQVPGRGGSRNSWRRSRGGGRNFQTDKQKNLRGGYNPLDPPQQRAIESRQSGITYNF